MARVKRVSGPVVEAELEGEEALLFEVVRVGSGRLLEEVVGKIRRCGFDIVHADLTIAAQAPKLSPYKESMRERLASLLGIGSAFVNVKATTTEGLGFVGRKEGVAVSAAATLKFHDWTRP